MNTQLCPFQDPVVQDERNGCGEGEVLPLQTERYQTARVHSSTYNSKAPRTALGFGGLLDFHKQRDTCPRPELHTAWEES